MALLRRSRRFVPVALVVFLAGAGLAAVPAAAQVVGAGRASAPALATDVGPAGAALAAPDISSVGAALAAAPDISRPGLAGPANPDDTRRPGALVPLYFSLGTLNALDVHSTRRALSHGASEANPLMKGVAGNAGALLAVKAAGTTGLIYASEKLWKKNRVAAVVFMVAANGAMALVVQHNYRAVR